MGLLIVCEWGRKMENIELVIENLVDWLKEKVEESNSKGIIFGLSGGIDSAVMAGLATRAFPDNSLGLIMPAHSIEQDEEDALLVAKAFGLKTSKIDLTTSFDTFLQATDSSLNNSLAKSNIKPRLRMTTLYYYAQSLGYLVAGPTNKSEYITGYFTKNGDSAVDIMPIADFVKSEIYDLAKALKVPDKIIEKVPSAGLWEDQSDEEEMGFSYETLEKYIRGEKIDGEVYERINTMYERSHHKRQYPSIFKK